MALFLRGLCLLAGYLFGGFLTAEVVARCTAGVSARDIGTGNPGMANIATHLGKKAGLLVLAGDVIKTAQRNADGQGQNLYAGSARVYARGVPLCQRLL